MIYQDNPTNRYTNSSDQSVYLDTMMEKVTLVISPKKGHFYTSNVQVTNENSNALQQSIQVVGDSDTEIHLGTLDELKNSNLQVDTIARKGDAGYDPEVSYIIRYGRTEVERQTMESSFNDSLMAMFGFRFKFCPRHPFC